MVWWKPTTSLLPFFVVPKFRNGQSTVGGPKWTKMALLRPKWTKWSILVHVGLANAKIRFGIRSFWPKWSFGPFWTILVQYTFRQYKWSNMAILKTKNVNASREDRIWQTDAMHPGNHYIRPPSPHVWPRGHFQGEGGGCVFCSPRGRNFIWPPPLLYPPPTPRRVFTGVKNVLLPLSPHVEWILGRGASSPPDMYSNSASGILGNLIR